MDLLADKLFLDTMTISGTGDMKLFVRVALCGPNGPTHPVSRHK